MKFKQFLIEMGKSYVNQSDIIYHSLLDNLDHGHISYTDNSIKMNIGKIIKDSKFNNLDLIIKHDKNNDIKLGKHKDSNISTIVIFTTRPLPDRTTIDYFLEDVNLAKKFKKYIQKYLELHHDVSSEKEVNSSSSYEKPKLYSKNFEEHYKTLTNDIHKRINEFKKAKNYLQVKTQVTGNEAKKQVAHAAVKSLFNQYFGSSFKEFKGKMMGLEGVKFLEHIPKDLKEKALSRLESFYDQEIVNLRETD